MSSTSSNDVNGHIGKCHCGGVQYQVTGKPIWTGYCHVCRI